MKEHGLITVVIPSKDPDLDFFEQALLSVINQSNPNWQLIIVDDHSKQIKTKIRYDEIRASLDTRISIIINKGQQISAAVNTGMKSAKTPFVCMLHADDLLDSSAIQVLTEQIEKCPDADYFHSARRFIDESSAYISGIYKPTMEFEAIDFRKGGQVKHLHCWRIKPALKIGGVDETLGPHGADDYDFPWCMAEAGYKFQPIDECLYYYRDHRNHPRLTTHVPLDIQVQELVKIFKKHNMDEEQIQEELELRQNGYLKQALYVNEKDKQAKEATGFDPQTGWKEPYE